MKGIITEAETFLKNAPNGTLYTRHNHNSVQYYCKYGAEKERYLKKTEKELVKQLAQKDYANKMIKFAMERVQALETNMLMYDRDEIVKFHEKLSKERQLLITPFVMSTDDYAELWLKKNRNIASKSNPYPLDIDSGIATEQGELVRSKSEKIIADKLYMMNVPYVYECKLTLKGNKHVYPDFTVLNRNTRKEFYWEHFGMMHESEYVLNAIKKISTYRKNDIYEGDKLLITQETSTCFIDVKELEGLIKKFFL